MSRGCFTEPHLRQEVRDVNGFLWTRLEGFNSGDEKKPTTRTWKLITANKNDKILDVLVKLKKVNEAKWRLITIAKRFLIYPTDIMWWEGSLHENEIFKQNSRFSNFDSPRSMFQGGITDASPSSCNICSTTNCTKVCRSTTGRTRCTDLWIREWEAAIGADLDVPTAEDATVEWPSRCEPSQGRLICC
jgi:hypothetical protein